MVQRKQRERSLFEVLLPDGHKLWPDWLRKIDTLLEDDAVIDVVAHALEAAEYPARRSARARPDGASLGDRHSRWTRTATCSSRGQSARRPGARRYVRLDSWQSRIRPRF